MALQATHVRAQSAVIGGALTKAIRSRTEFDRRKEDDDVLGGAAAYANVDSTEVVCAKCGHTRAYYYQLQTRSADEPMTTFYRCAQCAHQWREQ